MTDLSMSSALRAPPGYYTRTFTDTIYCPHNKLGTEFRRCVDGVGKVPTLNVERLWIIYQMVTQSLRIPGCFLECGVYVGGTALFIAQLMEGSGKMLHLFDTFTGMPKTNPERDWHLEGEFADAPIEQVVETVGHKDDVTFHKGLIPETFAGLEDARIAFAHIDTDIYRSTLDCCEFVYPRLVPGGVIVFDDYGQVSCDGARQAIDEYFEDKQSVPLTLMTKQAVVFKR